MLFLFELFPGLELLFQVGKGGSGKDMRMAVYHLGRTLLEDVSQRKPAFPFKEMGDEEQQEGHVAQFLADFVGIMGADGADQLVAFLNDVFSECLGSLDPVPFAAVRGSEPCNDGAQFFQCHFIIVSHNRTLQNAEIREGS